ncbi:MAG TPA: hypothetical protein VI854_04010 [Acidimicrobiia bacterium]|nr:hypothetical protein [Acidimicrobiia bacterium]
MRKIPLFLATASIALSGPAALAADSHDHEHHVVVIEHGRFAPAEIEVAAGEAVLWQHEDGDDPQSVTADDDSFDSHPECREDAPDQCLKGGQTFEHVFERAGRFPYHSRTEGGPGGQGMSGVVVVVEEGHDH